MAIRVTHGKISDIGRLGLEAGKGEQKVRQEAQQLERDLTTQSNNARLQAASINANTAIQKSIMDAQNMKELAEFDSFMRAESERRQLAWETEKIEAGQRHEFEMNIQRKDLENQMIAERDMRKEAEKDVKRNSLKKAREEKRITEDQLYEALLSIDMEISPAKALFGEGGELGIQQTSTYKSQLTEERKQAELNKPENVAMRVADRIQSVVEKSRRLDPETQKQVAELVSRPNVSEAAIIAMEKNIDESTAALDAQINAQRQMTSSARVMGSF